MERRCLLAFAMIFAAVPATAGVDPVRSTREARVDNRQISTDRAVFARDAAEIAEFQRWLAELADACRDRMSGRYQETNTRVCAAMEREMRQAEVKRARASHETRQSRREVRGEQMEASTSGSPIDRLQAADDRHDRRDDRRDRHDATTRCAELKRIGGLSASLQDDVARGNRGAMQKNLELAREFLAVMREDAGASATELTEDKVERREDRRERKTDRR